MPLSDNQIIEKIRRGGKHHYALLVDRYKDRAFTLAVRMLKDRRDAEEAAQDAFMRAYNGLDKFEGTAKFGTWLYRIVHNVCLTKLAKRRNDVHSSEYDDNQDYENAGMTSTTLLESEIETKDMIDAVKKIIDTLPEKYTSILSLFYFQELTHEEICEITQLPLGTVKVHLFRARALLQRRLNEELSMEIV